MKLLRARLAGQVAIPEIAEACRLSPCYFIRTFTETVGVSPYAWLIERRIEQACVLIGDNVMPIAQVALECGFADQSHLTKAFLKQMGMTPARWRQTLSQA
ncbi:AraC family transcriptional regulator [Novosphingobium sp. KA1]|nr:AraC family transcriptional regulator [Novosphingobium sp. KA1]